MKRHAPWLLLLVLALLVGGGLAVGVLELDPRPRIDGGDLAHLDGTTSEQAHEPGLAPGEPRTEAHPDDPLVGDHLPAARRGWVIDEQQRGVAGARVRLELIPLRPATERSSVRWGSGRWPWGRAEHRRLPVESWTTDARGRFELPARWSHAAGRLVAEPGGDHIGGTVAIDAGDDRGGDVVIVVASAHAVRGRVVRAGQPPPGGFVALCRLDPLLVGEPIVWSPLAPDGGFETVGPANEPAGFWVEDHEGSRWSDVPARREPDGTYLVELAGRRDGLVHGLVRHADGRPVAEAAVYLLGDVVGGGRWRYRVLTDERGTWAVPGAPPLRELTASLRETASLQARRTVAVASDEGDVYVELVLPACRDVDVLVVGGSGEPLESVRVLLSAGDGQMLAVTSHEGRAHFDAVPESARGTLEVDAPGWQLEQDSRARLVLPVDAATTPLLVTLPMRPIGPQVVQVRDGEGAPVAGATVLLVPTEGVLQEDFVRAYAGVYTPGRTDAAGRVELAALPPRTSCTVHVRSEDGRESTSNVTIAPGLEPLEVIHDVPGPLTGRVLDDAGQPLPFLTLVLDHDDDSRAQAASTGVDGRFVFPSPLAGACTLVSGPDPVRAETTIHAEVPAERPAAGLDVGDLTAYRDDWIVAGWVESTTGQLLPGVEVTCRAVGGEGLRRNTTGDAGRFWIRLPVATFGTASWSKPLTVRVEAPGVPPLDVRVPGDPVRLVAGPGLRRTLFHFVDFEGAPLASGEVELSFRELRFGFPGWRLPIDRGNVSVDLPAEGTSPLTVLVRGAYSASGHAMVAGWVETVDVAGRDRVEVRVPRGRTLRGRVEELEGGAPVRDANLHVRFGGTVEDRRTQRFATTDADGRFELEGLPDITLSLQLHMDAWAMEGAPLLTVPVGQEDVVVRVRLPRQLVVSVTAPDGTPLPRASIRVVPAGLEDQVRPVIRDTDDDGLVTLGGLPHAPLWVSFRYTADRSMDVFQPQPLLVGAEERSAHLRLQRAASLRGRVLAPFGASPRKLVVLVRKPGDDTARQRASIREDGTFALGSLAPGPYEIRVTMAHGARASAWRAVNAPADGLELAPAPGDTAVVRILGGHLGVVAVLLGEGGRSERMLESNPSKRGDSRYEVHVRAEGGSLLLTEWQSGRHARHDGLRPGDDVSVRLEAGTPTRASLSHEAWPFGPAWARVEATDGLRFVSGSIDDAARFVTFQGLPPGRWTIEALVGVDRTRRFRATDVEPGQAGIVLVEVDADK